MRIGALTIALSLLSGSFAAGTPLPEARTPLPGVRGPGVRVWTNSGDLFRRNERVRIYYRTERDAFVSILRVDTDGRVRVLFPRSPMDDGWTPAGVTQSVSNWDRGVAFVVDDYPGVGYIFAIASSEPFDYRSMHDGDRWDLRGVSDGRIHGDPRSSLEELMIGALPRDYEDFDTHILAYHVERRYDYPRFVCYDCHTYTSFTYWNPYHSYCRSYTLVVWNDPWYYYPSYWYPTRYYGGRRVVYSYPRTSPRYVFKERDSRTAGIDYRRREQGQPSSPAPSGGGRRIDERGVRGEDIGGVGRVPAPRTGRDVREGEGRDGRESPVTGGRRTGGTETGRPEPRSDVRGGDVQRGDVQRGESRPESRREPGIEIVPSQRDIERPSRQNEPRPEVVRPDRGTERPQPQPRPEAARPETQRPDRGSERPQPQARPEAPRARPEARPSAPQRRPETRPQPAPRSDGPSRGGSDNSSGGRRRP